MYVFVCVICYLSSSWPGHQVRGDQNLDKASVRTEGWLNRAQGAGKDCGQMWLGQTGQDLRDLQICICQWIKRVLRVGGVLTKELLPWWAGEKEQDLAVLFMSVSTVGVYVGARKNTALFFCVNLCSWTFVHFVCVYLYFWSTCSDLLPSGHPKGNSSKQTGEENSPESQIWPDLNNVNKYWYITH